MRHLYYQKTVIVTSSKVSSKCFSIQRNAKADIQRLFCTHGRVTCPVKPETHKWMNKKGTYQLIRKWTSSGRLPLSSLFHALVKLLIFPVLWSLSSSSSSLLPLTSKQNKRATKSWPKCTCYSLKLCASELYISLRQVPMESNRTTKPFNLSLRNNTTALSISFPVRPYTAKCRIDGELRLSTPTVLCLYVGTSYGPPLSISTKLHK